MRKVMVVAIVFVLCTLFSAQMPAQTFTITIWVDKGCGEEYFVGDMLTVYWRASHACTIVFWEEEPDGTRRKLTTQGVMSAAGEGSRGWTLKDYGYGKRAVYVEASSLFGSDTARCEYYVLKKAADIQVTVKDQDGEPVSGAHIQFDGVSVGTTDADGVYTISEAEFGEHTITCVYNDEEQENRIRIASTQTQYMNFVFTVEKRGSITVQVHNQHGDPLEADIYVDGFKEGISSDGTFTVSTQEGTHFVEAQWEEYTAQKSVTVVRNQTSFIDLVITVHVDTTLQVTVQDDTGALITDAIVYVDNIFLGRTTPQGIAQGNTTPGAHVVRIEKQGYQSTTKNIAIQEGENTTTVTIQKEEVPAYGILVVIGVLLLALAKRQRYS
jgi:hypothetical protein